MPELERGDRVRFRYTAEKYPNGEYEGHVTGIGPRRIVINSNGNLAYITDPDDLLYIVEKNNPKHIHNLAEDAFRFSGGLGQDPLVSYE